MPQFINVPGMGRVSFPDGMPDDQIVAAIKANQPQQESSGEGFTEDILKNKVGGALVGAADIATGLGKMIPAAGYGLMGMAQHGPAMGKKIMQEAMSDFTPSNLVPEMRDTSGYKAAEMFMPSLEPIAQGYGNIAAGISSLQDKINPLSSKTEQQSNVAAGEQGQNMADTAEVGLTAGLASPIGRVPPRPGSMAAFAEKYQRPGPSADARRAAQIVNDAERAASPRPLNAGQMDRPMNLDPTNIDALTLEQQMRESQAVSKTAPPGELGIDPATAPIPNPVEKAPLGVADPSWQHNIQDPTKLAEQALQAEIAPRTPTDIPIAEMPPQKGSIEAVQPEYQAFVGDQQGAPLGAIQKTGTPPLGKPPGWDPYAVAHEGDLTTTPPTKAPPTPEELAFIGEQPRSPFGGVGKKEGGAILFPFKGKEGEAGKKIPLLGRKAVLEKQKAPLEADMDHLVTQYNEAKAAGDMGAVRALGPEIDATQKALDRVNLDLMSIEKTEARPKADVIPFGKGPGGKQAGGIDFFNKDDPKFRQFKEALPKEQQRWAKEWWKQLEKERLDKEALTPEVKDVAGRGAVGAIPGLNEALKYIEPIEGKSPKDIVEIALTEPDLNFKLLGGLLPAPQNIRNRIGRGMTPGASLTGFAKQSTAAQFFGQELNRAKIAANKVKYERLLDPDKGLMANINRLGDQSTLWDRMAKMVNKEGEISYDGLTSGEITAHKQYRQVANAFFEDMNGMRAELGYPPIKKVPNWVPGVFQGDFQFYAYRKHIKEDGSVIKEIIERIGRNDRYSAGLARRKVSEKYKDDLNVVVEDVQHRPMRGVGKQDANRVFNSIEDMLPDGDPIRETIDLLREQYALEQPFQFGGIPKHFKARKTEAVRGARGFDDLKTQKQNAKEGFQSSLAYLEQAADWIETQKAALKVKDILTSPELQEARPELMKYLNLYWQTASKQGTRISRAVEDISAFLADASGIGGTHGRNITRNVKSALTLSYLTTPTFMGVQSLQPLQMMPTWMSHMVAKGAGNAAHPAIAMAMGNADFIAFLAKDPLLTMSPGGKQALAWAHKNQALIPHMLDDIRLDTATRVLQGSRDVSTFPLRKIEEVTRTYAYLGYAHFLELAGMEKGPILYETALNLTNMSMTDYRLHERPLVYQQLGVIGEAMSTLTAFKHNNYGQFLAFAGEAKGGNYTPWLTMVAGGLLFSGLSGMWFREDIDNIITGINMSVWKGKEPIPTTMGYMLKELPDWATFGGVSMLTGQDLSSRFSQAKMSPEMGAGTVFPYTRDILKRADAVKDFATNPSGTTAAQAAYANAPNFAKGFMEEGLAKNSVSPDIMKDRGNFVRDEKDRNARYLAGRSLKEARTMVERRQFDLGETFRENKRQEILEKAYVNPGARASLEKDYVKLSDHPASAPMEFVNKMKEHDYKKNITPEQELKRDSYKNPNKTKRRMEFNGR